MWYETDTLIHRDLPAKWDNYHRLRTSGDKKGANRLLQEFIHLMKQEEYGLRKAFTDEICRLCLGEDFIPTNGRGPDGEPIRIQHPLFRDILLPVLLQEYKNNSPLHIRWIAQFQQFFYSDLQTNRRFMEAIGEEGYFTEFFFLEKTFLLQQDPVTVELLLKSRASLLNYYTHEVPWAVLVNPDCMDNLLEDFQKYYCCSDQPEKWSKALEWWQRIARHWRIYNEQQQYAHFEEYLIKNKVDYK